MFRSTPYSKSCPFAAIAAFVFIVILSGCGEPPKQTTSGLRKTVTSTGDTLASRSPSDSSANVNLTLPVLDALFFEEGFEEDLKTTLQLTGQQIEKLKTVSHESVAELTEEGSGDYHGSARGATMRYEEQIRGAIGDEKAGQLAQLVNHRYASGDVEGLLPATPNAVPTDTRIVVNTPAYRMDVFQDGKLAKSYRIGIGYPEFPLPTGMRRAETIIFNPTWTPPDEPWVKGKFKPGKKIEAGSKDNPLGSIKIPIGSPSLIHGGKAVARLGNFASHGCVGMTNDQVQDFAISLAQLSGSALTKEDIVNYRKQKGETKSLKLTKAVPVELRYETIVAEDGALRIFRDVYERGTNTLEAARRMLDIYGVSYDSLPAQEQQALAQALSDMNRDPQGKAIAEHAGGAHDTASGELSNGGPDSGRKDGVAASKLAGARKGKVTSTIVGRKEIAVPIASLQGKGYPTPANLDAGGRPSGKK